MRQEKKEEKERSVVSSLALRDEIMTCVLCLYLLNGLKM